MALPSNHPLNEMVISAYLADISAPSSAFAVSPVRGKIVKVWTVLQGAISVADAVVTAEINGTAVSGVSITVANSGSAGGDVDSAVPTGANAINEDDVFEWISNGASSTTAAAMCYAKIRVNWRCARRSPPLRYRAR
jgi:hypothetical protein